MFQFFTSKIFLELHLFLATSYNMKCVFNASFMNAEILGKLHHDSRVFLLQIHTSNIDALETVDKLKYPKRFFPQVLTNIHWLNSLTC